MRTGLMAFLMLPKAARPSSSRRHLSASSAGFSFSFSGAWRGEGERLRGTHSQVGEGWKARQGASFAVPRPPCCSQANGDGRTSGDPTQVTGALGYGCQKLNRVKRPRVEEDGGRRDNIFLEILKDGPDVPLSERQIP